LQCPGSVSAMFALDFEVLETADDDTRGIILATKKKTPEHGDLMLGRVTSQHQVTEVTASQTRSHLPDAAED
jgi:hypothetical protein